VLESERENRGMPPEEKLTRPRLENALRRETVAVIAEVKRSSPSKGSINQAIDASVQAELYASGGAAALSILTEPSRFGGSNDDVTRARSAELPILKKDFHVSEAQLVEASEIGASAALIIVRAIEPDRLVPMAAAAREIDLEIIFEIRNELELERALEAGATMIGVNNRNLETLEMDPTTVQRILPMIPGGCVAIAESGYSTVDDVRAAADAGADAVLIGSSLSASADPESAVAALASVPRRDIRR
jgi:indole-3-glycerol phosphate synthase